MTIQYEHLLTLYSLVQNWICLAVCSISTPGTVLCRGWRSYAFADEVHWGETLLTTRPPSHLFLLRMETDTFRPNTQERDRALTLIGTRREGTLCKVVKCDSRTNTKTSTQKPGRVRLVAQHLDIFKQPIETIDSLPPEWTVHLRTQALLL